MTGHARAERRSLCDLLLEVGPDAPTLCEDWATRHLAAHLVLRERRPDVGLGLVLGGPFARHTARTTDRLGSRSNWARLVERLRAGPPPVARPFDEAMNLVEFFVHHEAVRRAIDGWEPRETPIDVADALWDRQRARTPMQVRRVRDVALTIARPGGPRWSIRRRGTVTGGRPVLATGEPGELALFFFGRRDQALVELTGDPAGVAEVRSARFGI